MENKQCIQKIWYCLAFFHPQSICIVYQCDDVQFLFYSYKITFPGCFLVLVQHAGILDGMYFLKRHYINTWILESAGRNSTTQSISKLNNQYSHYQNLRYVQYEHILFSSCINIFQLNSEEIFFSDFFLVSVLKKVVTKQVINKIFICVHYNVGWDTFGWDCYTVVLLAQIKINSFQYLYIMCGIALESTWLKFRKSSI
eukprot:TRINITY_DN8708_c0_g1_i1.p3 TRINITY_DN8708_c0_g1~~TRINITY_DN8708_c0_g1_i1.p3  ORF type:complete len:199 (+),score=-9.34 TRINITY_DN8708_c0_g1_i1:101-697(+)